MSDPLRILFMGTPDFSVPIFEALANSHHQVVGVVTNPDRQAGRGKKVLPPPVKEAALPYNIPIFQPDTLRKNNKLYEELSGLHTDVAVVVAYGQILPQRFLNLPRHGSLNVHASLLPKYRGASPINAAIIHGEKKSGVTIMRMEKGLDTGPILLNYPVDITDDMTAQDLHDVLSQLSAKHIVAAVEAWCSGQLTPTPQSNDDASYAPMMSKQDGKIDWRHDATTVVNLIRGVTPWPGAQTLLLRGEDNPIEVKILRARVSHSPLNDNTNSEENTPVVGKLTIPNRDTLLVRCGSGHVQLLELQPAGKRPLSPRDFINGFQPNDSFRFIS